jgi:hypothetical protein
MSVYLSTYVSVYLSTYMSVYLSTYMSVYLSTYMSVNLSILMSVYLSFCLLPFTLLSHIKLEWEDLCGAGPALIRQIWFLIQKWQRWLGQKLFSRKFGCQSFNFGATESPPTTLLQHVFVSLNTISPFKVFGFAPTPAPPPKHHAKYLVPHADMLYLCTYMRRGRFLTSTIYLYTIYLCMHVPFMKIF